MLLAILALGALADLITTAIALKRGGYEEITPLARKLYDAIGFWPAAIGIKIAGLALCFVLGSVVFTGVLAALQMLAVAWNIKELRK